MSLRIIPARFAGTCRLCHATWTAGTPIAPFPDSSQHAGGWGHPACIAADEMGAPSVEVARERIAQIRQSLTKEQSA